VTVLITGIAGFVGGHLVEFLRAEHPEVGVAGLIRPGHEIPGGLREGVRLMEADLEDPVAVEAAVSALRPQRIVHLAGQSSVHESWANPAATLRTNVIGLLNVFEAVHRRRLAPRVLVVGSAEEYGAVDAGAPPLTEDAPLRPLSPYAVSKVAQGYLALQYALSRDLPVVRTRTFPHTGPGRGAAFAESSFARQIAEVEAGRRRPLLEVGNLEAVRDFTDVRDVVRAYWALLERGASAEVYNVCSGQGRSIGDILRALLEISGVRADLKVDRERLRPSDLPSLVGDPAKLRTATGWEPRIPLERTFRDLLDHWRERVGAAAPPAAPQGRS
jgi:GDP-4-dehydro-6-deoxy-D-mannose reductase